jgi:hypothetical protein
MPMTSCWGDGGGPELNTIQAMSVPSRIPIPIVRSARPMRAL